ncbi:origin recognition complex subunit Orc4,putative [Blumeria hordei DH14]|uniref:Origin recognition complex subunit 4 n=1 Tax=Blumeria graminis f. sp. hordei (strain DH14) TaxID=546991 RepID=N1J7M5_BLUG1|nr:origin recognition complex subunit Orc4,putative [Blumeria hordei DH14]
MANVTGSLDKDIYDISSSEAEQPREAFRRKGNTIKLSSSKVISNEIHDSRKSISKKNVGVSEVAKNKRGPKKNLLKSTQLGSIHENTDNEERRTSPDLNTNEKKVAIVEIPSLNLGQIPKLEKAYQSHKQDRKDELGIVANTSKMGRKQYSKSATRSKRKMSPIIEIQCVEPEPTAISPSLHPSKAQVTHPQKSPSKLLEPSTENIKSILSPTKRKDHQKKKNVVFKIREDLDLGFKDLPVGKGANKQHEELNSKIDSTNKGGVRAFIDISGPEDDTACEVCRRYDVEKNNPMLLCDGCDSGYHVKCIGLSKEPETEMWFCHICKSRVSHTQRHDLGHVESVDCFPQIENFDNILMCHQRDILDRLTGRKLIKLKGLEDEVLKVRQIIENTILAGEGNSMLVVGARGTGKTALVESVISEVSELHRKNFHVVRLNGLIHTDDKIALKEIWRQLGREMDVFDEPTGRPSNHADIFASLLALLSHPSEISGTDSNQTATSVIFVMDEFDLFTSHYRQILLYNLFDIAQARKAPIAILGLTTKVDVAENLEKRVKSRFSHRFVYLSLPRSLSAFWEICKEGLMVPETVDNNTSLLDHAAGSQEFKTYWNNQIENLYFKDGAFIQHIQAIYYQTKSVSTFFNSCILPIANLSSKNPILRGESFVSILMPLSEPDSKLHILQGLSELELALLICAARLDIILDTDTCNFAMAYDEYSSLACRHKIMASSSGVVAIGSSFKIWGRDVSISAWEKLADYELLVPAGYGGNQGKYLGASEQMWRADIGLEEIAGSVEGLGGIMSKWCKEI